MNGTSREARAARTFFVQYHGTGRPHFDLYLEFDRRLVGWSMPQPPSPDPRRRRFALRTPDRDLEFGRFEGRIPPGEPGEVTVLVWDLGTYEAYPPKGLSEEAWLARGLLRLHFSGEKLRGLWEMVRWGPASGARERWVLVKLRDRHVRPTSELDTALWSALTGREPREVAEGAPPLRGGAPAAPTARERAPTVGSGLTPRRTGPPRATEG